MKKFGILLVLVLLWGCQSAAPPKEFSQERASIYLERAAAYYQEGRLAEALEEALKAQEAYPEDPEVYNLIGLIYMDRHEYQKAIENFQKAISLRPQYSEAINNLGSVYLLQGKIKEAIRCFQKALENPLYTRPYIAYTNLAWAYYQLGDKEKAIEYLNKALSYNPRYHLAYFYRGIMALNDGELERARISFRRAVRFNRQDMAARYYLGLVYFRLGQEEKAKKVWRSILQLAPESEWALKAEDKLLTLEELEKD